MKFTRITVNPEQMNGVPCIRGLRIPVSMVIGMVANGMKNEDILQAYPDLPRWWPCWNKSKMKKIFRWRDPFAKKLAAVSANRYFMFEQFGPADR
ncbi:MAG: DUF433 domain-containing protein [Calditrichia bacterium]